jgi:hypothetical protein
LIVTDQLAVIGATRSSSPVDQRPDARPAPGLTGYVNIQGERDLLVNFISLAALNSIPVIIV